MKKSIIFTSIFLLLLSCSLQSFADTAGDKGISVLYLRIQGTINPAVKDLLNQAIQKARAKDYDSLMLGIDTPGGLGSSMRNMVQSILNSPVPIITWVGPRGARAASAGVFLVAASRVAAMSPQTNIGSASPVKMGGKDMSSTMAKKIQKDFLSLIRSVAKSRDRNVSWYQKAVREADNITASEALEKNVIDFVAKSPKMFMHKLSSQGIKWEGKKVRFEPQKVEIVEYQPGMRYSFLSWLLDPQIAYFLLLGGLAGIFFELSNPGSIFPGAFGGICLLLGLYAMSTLPTNAAGLLLIVLSLVLFILELAVASYGLLSLGGLIALFTGSMILFRFEYGFMQLSLQSILPAVLVITIFICLVLYLVTKAQFKSQSTGAQAMLGLEGKIIEWKDGWGKAKIRGEIWNVSSYQQLSPGTHVKVKAIQGLNLIVEPISPKNNFNKGEN